MKKITTTAGAAFLIWLLFSPVIGLFLFSKMYPYSAVSTGPSPLVYIAATYLILGIATYYLVKSTSGVFLKEYKPSEWGIAVSYTILTSMIYNVVMSLFYRLTHETSISLVSLLLSPFVFWIIVRIRAHSVSPVSRSVVKKSIYLFFIVNLVFILLFKFLMNQLYVSVTDLMLILHLIIFYFTTKKYLVSIENTNQ